MNVIFPGFLKMFDNVIGIGQFKWAKTRARLVDHDKIVTRDDELLCELSQTNWTGNNCPGFSS